MSRGSNCNVGENNGGIDYALLTGRHVTSERLIYGRPRRVSGVESSLACDWSKPLQAGSVSFAVETLFMALAAVGLGFVALYFAVTAGPASSERFRAFPRPSWGEHLIGATAHLCI